MTPARSGPQRSKSDKPPRASAPPRTLSQKEANALPQRASPKTLNQKEANALPQRASPKTLSQKDANALPQRSSPRTLNQKDANAPAQRASPRTLSQKDANAPAQRASPRTLSQKDANALPQRSSTPAAAAGGSGDTARAVPRTPKPPVTGHAKRAANVRCPVVTENKDQAHQDGHILPDKSAVAGDQGRPRSAASLPRPEAALGLGAKMTARDVEAVELRTRGQRENPDWFAWRQNRITASAAHRISHSRFVNGKSDAPAASYLAAVTGTGPNVKTRAMAWGIEHEAEAVRRYQSLKSEALGRPVLVRECGLFVDPQRPWLAASPDGIVQEASGERLLSLEVKCPYKHRENTVARACREDRDFCLQLRDDGGEPHYRLKPGHSYYTQIQCQMAVTGLPRADLVVYTEKETAVVPVEFDPEFWEGTQAKLERFYTDAVLPLAGGRGSEHPAVRPEE